ncbi:MAG: hypothetical protein MUF49_30750 [Oculatellaceae cyanobacterium Prado106]|jgi:hypothetical protein|nr:hypothetical protein [Oculatellaceae cyanobacterium Prado106]
MKTAFLILGAQRSGTSVTSHLLSKLGVCFGNPEHFLQDNHNPNFFELKWVNQYNDRILQTIGHRYTDAFFPLETDYEGDSLSETLHERILTLEQTLGDRIQQEWPNEPIIGIKDPRFSLTFPVWQRVLSHLGYRFNIVLVFRHPSDFLRSNQKLFHNWEGWTVERHLHFWLRLTLAGIYFTRDYPVCWVDYDQVMTHPLEVAQGLADRFNLDHQLADQAAAVVDRTYQHHRQSSPTGYPLFDRAYQSLKSHHLSSADYLSYRLSMLQPAMPDPDARP